jgi:DNA (cytosine-5)-methyltransferase 1
VRRLSPREVARLQGFSDNFQLVGSDTQKYKQLGNSVCVPMFADVLRGFEILNAR